MQRLVQEIAGHIRSHVAAAVARLARPDGEMRTVFHGPPMEFLAPLFEVLTKEGGIEATLGNGDAVTVPVLLQRDSQQLAGPNPPIGQSGICDETHVINCRNAPVACPRYIVLVPPGSISSLTLATASNSFGLLAHSNSGTATSFEWWSDAFVQALVSAALDRHAWAAREKDSARTLIEKAVLAADKIDKNVAARPGAWKVLSRVWSISDPKVPFGTQLSLACGFPPNADGSVDAAAQEKVLTEVSDRLIDGFRSAIEALGTVGSDGEKRALEELLGYLQARCDVGHRFSHAPAYYYEPSATATISAPPTWWSTLTTEVWRRLLDGDEDEVPEAALVLVCHNAVMPKAKGIGPVVSSGVELSVTNEDGVDAPAEVTVTREMAGAANRRQWQVKIGAEPGLSDPQIPLHKTPVRYTVEGDGIKKTTIRVVALATWEPGVVAFSRTATKTSLPKRVTKKSDGTAFEIALGLSGPGRHYVDLYVRPGVTLSTHALGSGDDGSPDETRSSAIGRVGESNTYGFEVDASGDCYYQFQVTRDVEVGPENYRIYFSCDEAAPEQCNSEFERLIRLNRTKTSGSSMAVNVNRQLRCADLQGWLLTREHAAHSFRPYVLGLDYGAQWRARDWGSPKLEETIFSGGRYLHDPRPLPEEIAPPERFVQLRTAILERIRGPDEAGLVEAATLGEWLATDIAFAQLIEEYVEVYGTWLDASPETAAWCDVGIVSSFESDGTTLVQDPDAIVLSPLHPVRLAWHASAQRALYLAQRKRPCPAASVLEPDAIPDVLVLPLRAASGGIEFQPFFSVECSSDYWSILWNASRLNRLPQASMRAPFDKEFGVLVGGVSSGFSASQVNRALDDVADIFSAKPLLNIAVSSAAGQNNACNEGIMGWCRGRFGFTDDQQRSFAAMGPRIVQILDERPAQARPEDAEVSNLAEDTSNAVRWLEKRAENHVRPDLTVIAQLETSNPKAEQVQFASPLGVSGLIRHRIRQQLPGGNGAFLTESRMAAPLTPSGDGLADKTASALVRLENLGQVRYGYTFAPSVNAIKAALATEADDLAGGPGPGRSDYVAVSSAAVDPACFLGGWLQDMYLWDYELPSYSQRSGDSNGYYLLSRIKPLDKETLQGVLSKLPGCESMTEQAVEQVILEVARRGIPTVRGLSSGNSGASGDLGLFVTSRLIQDEFRTGESPGSLLRVVKREGNSVELSLVIPVDPFKGYIEDLAKATGQPSLQRPDLLVAGVVVSDSQVTCRLTPVEVKYRGKEPMPVTAVAEALKQAKNFSGLLASLVAYSRDPELVAWKLAFQHLLSSMLGFGMRVYSQQRVALSEAAEWASLHQRLIGALLGDTLQLEIDSRGRLVVLDGSPVSEPRDVDGDGFAESMVINRKDASAIVQGSGAIIYEGVRKRLGSWDFMPLDVPIPILAFEPMQVAEKHPDVTPEVDRRPIEPVMTSEPEKDQPRPTSGGLSEQQPENSGVSLLVGQTVDGFETETRHFNLSDTNLNQLNIGVVGDLGTGKTQLLQSLVYQIVSSGAKNRGIRPRFLIFDYKKDYSSESFVKAVNAKVVKPHHLPINLFDVAGAGDAAAPWLDRFRFFADVLDKVFSGVGPVQRAQLKTAVRQAYEQCQVAGRQPTIYDVHANYKAMLGNKSDAPMSIIDDLVDMEIFSPEPSSLEGVQKFLDGVVVISLHALGQDDRTKNMLVAIMLNIFYEQMLRIPKRPFVGESPQLRAIDSFLLVDEADNIMRYEFDVLRKVLLQGREFGVGVVLASQYLRHFKAGATDYREPLLSWFIHKVPNVVPQELAAIGLTNNVAQLSERVKMLGKHECLFKTYNVPGEIVRGTPFYTIAPKS